MKNPPRGYCCVGLHQPKDSINVGHVLRAAGCFRAAMIVTSGTRYKVSCTDTIKQYRHTPMLQVDDLRSVVPYDCVPVAVDLIDDARCLVNYIHPERAFYIFGPEDGSLSHGVTDWCRDVVSIPTHRCLNLSACVNIVLYDRMAKTK